MASDFNNTRNLSEHNGNSYGMRRRCEKINHWIENNNPMELDFSGTTFTWNKGNSPETRKWARLPDWIYHCVIRNDELDLMKLHFDT
ncbi:hypothetical protein vseg_013267 [Gypsophila vaccaria]